MILPTVSFKAATSPYTSAEIPVAMTAKQHMMYKLSTIFRHCRIPEALQSRQHQFRTSNNYHRNECKHYNILLYIIYISNPHPMIANSGITVKIVTQAPAAHGFLRILMKTNNVFELSESSKQEPTSVATRRFWLQVRLKSNPGVVHNGYETTSWTSDNTKYSTGS